MPYVAADVLLERFHEAQDRRHSGYEEALTEIRNGRKRGHWIWYVLPQLVGLGQSSMSRAYAIAGRAEAEAYLRDPVLSARYLEITTAIADQLTRGVGLETLMGSATDAQKLASSLTLFGDVAAEMSPRDAQPTQSAIAQRAVDLLRAAALEGYKPCAFTRRQLERG
jgi:uncharacterized protein (DUF1810 family)